VKPRFYPVLIRALEEGARLGYRRAFKHCQNPSEDQIVEHILDACLLVLGEHFVLEDDSTES
jgi:predicted Zn-dependent protease with MMP-like domain